MSAPKTVGSLIDRNESQLNGCDNWYQMVSLLNRWKEPRAGQLEDIQGIGRLTLL